MTPQTAANDDNPFALPVTLDSLEEDLERALEDGLSIPAYEARLADQQALWKRQSPKDRDIWNQMYRHRLSRHVLRASMAKNKALVDLLWERVVTFTWSPNQAIPLLELALVTHRPDAFDTVADRLSGEMSDKEIDVLYNRAFISANGPLLACLMERFPATPNPYHVSDMLDRGGPDVASKVDLLLGTPMVWCAGPLSLLPKMLTRGLWVQAEQLWAREPLIAGDDEENVLDALDVALTQGQGAWSDRLMALFPPGNPQGIGWNILATNVEESMPSERLADQARRLGPVAQRKVWVKFLAEEKWDALDRLSTLVPLSWIQALADMPEVIAHLPQAQARICAHQRAHHLSERAADSSVRPRPRA